MSMISNVNKGNVYKNSSQINFKRGLKIGCINVRGLVSNVSKRVELNHWLELNDLDVVCIQEWFVPHSKITRNESKQLCLNNDVNKCNNNVNIECNVKTKGISNGNSNKKDENILNQFSEFMYENFECQNDRQDIESFENEKKHDKKYLTVSLDMTAFPRYSKIEVNTKTIILYKTGIEIIKFDKIEQISEEGLDVTWLAIETNRCLIVIGSVYHSPSYECSYDEIGYQLNHIKRITKKYKNSITILGGDYNAKHTLWGSSCIDKRGIELNDWMGCNQLSFCNNGTNTYGTKKKGDVLDITMISQKDTNVVK